MTDDLAEIERIAGAILRSLSSGERRTLMRQMARALVISQRERIAAQKNRTAQPSNRARRKRRSPDAARCASSVPRAAAAKRAASS